MDNLESKIEEQANKIKPMVCVAIANTDIDDVMQEIRLSFFVAFPRFNGDSELSTYAHAIARKIIAQYFRRKYKIIKECHAAKLILLGQVEMGSKKNGNCDLSKSEKKVLKLVGEGMNNAEIGESLNISYYTVRSHMKNIYDKLQYKDRVKLALFSYKFFRRRDNEN
jgi:DNA-binding NarL/FixJ family response regulator